MLSRQQVQEIAERAETWKGETTFCSNEESELLWSIPSLIVSLSEAMEALGAVSENFKGHNYMNPDIRAAEDLLSLWNQVPSEDTRPESIRDLPDDPGDGHNAD